MYAEVHREDTNLEWEPSDDVSGEGYESESEVGQDDMQPRDCSLYDGVSDRYAQELEVRRLVMEQLLQQG